MRDPIGDAGLVDGGNGIAAADDRGAFYLGDGASNRVRATRESGNLEDTHGTVPDNGLGILDHARVQRNRLRADVETHPIANLRVADVEDFALCSGVELVRDDMID